MSNNFNKSSAVIRTIILAIIMSSCHQMVNTVNLDNIKWIHGSKDCLENIDPPIQVVQYDNDTWILRQNKCTNYEAPFMYLFIGEKKALLMDTGATKDEKTFPLFKTINQILSDWKRDHGTELELIVAHTHNHSDHKAADGQFIGKPNTKIVGLKVNEVNEFFNIKNWPFEYSTFDLGNREINIIPIPGHEEASIAIYDHRTKILLTGDSFYPGRLYIRDWMAFKASIERLVDFTANNHISTILGNHIEMSKKPGKDYPVESIFQPEEMPLSLSKDDLKLLHKELTKLGRQPKRKILDKFIIYPIPQN